MSMPNIAPTMPDDKHYMHLKGTEKRAHEGSQSMPPEPAHAGHPMTMKAK